MNEEPTVNDSRTTGVTSEDRIAIIDLLARYCVYLDRDDIDRWVELFTDDVAYTVYGHTFDGHDGLRRMVGGALGGLHLGGAPVIDEVDADRVEVHQSLLFFPVGDEPMRRATYTDEIMRTSSGWRIARRRCDFITAEGLSERP